LLRRDVTGGYVSRIKGTELIQQALMSNYRFYNPHDEYDYLGNIDMRPDGGNILASAAPSSDVFDDYMNELCEYMLSEPLYIRLTYF